MNAAPLCTEGQFIQRAPQRLFNDYNNLQFSDLTTNRAVTDAVSQLMIGILNWSLDRLFAVRISLNQPRPTRLWKTSQLLEGPD